MIKGSFLVLCVWVFVFDSIEYDVDGKPHPPPVVLVRISFCANDPENSRKFFNEQFAPAFEDLTKCVLWEFEPIFVSNPDSPHISIGELYGCANSGMYSEYNRGKFYICMMSNGEDIFQASECADSSGLDWNNDLMYCNPHNLDPHLLHQQLAIDLIVEKPNMSDICPQSPYDFKNSICKKLKEINKPCACCP